MESKDRVPTTGLSINFKFLQCVLKFARIKKRVLKYVPRQDLYQILLFRNLSESSGEHPMNLF